MTASLSVIVPCYNDYEAFNSTLRSLANELLPLDQIVVVDSSDDTREIENIIKRYDHLDFEIRKIWIEPAGVYSAFNAGLQNSSREFIQIVNSGDLYLPGARTEIFRATSKEDSGHVHVFSQIAILAGAKDYLFTPTLSGVWPTQSVIMREIVHREMGLFNENYKIISDQIYYLNVRKSYFCRTYNQPITTYDLDGISSKVNFRNLLEFYEMWRIFGRSRIISFANAFLKPILRSITSFLFGKSFVIVVKTKMKFLFPQYSQRIEHD
jgi:glycosyltransferase involved in cell wall biosynthesis